MTEINKDLSLNGLNFGNPKQVKKEPAEEQAPKTEPQEDKTNLDIAPGAIYGRVGIKSAKSADTTKECVNKTVENFEKHSDAHVLSDKLFDVIYEEAIAEGLSPRDAYLKATEAAHNYLTDMGETE